MSEQWAIVLLTGVVGWVAYELRTMRGALERFVTKDECIKKMDGHCEDIKDLWEETREQGERISRLETIHEGDKKQ